MLFESQAAELLYYTLQRFDDERYGFLDLNLIYIKGSHELEETIETSYEEDEF